MKAFSRIPDPFQQQYQNASFSIPLRKLFQIQAISQGKNESRHVIFTNKQTHLTINCNQPKTLSLTINQKAELEPTEQNQNTAVKQAYPVPKKMEIKQKLNETKNQIKIEQKIYGGLLKYSQVCLKPYHTQTMLQSLVANYQLQQLTQNHNSSIPQIQSQINRAIYFDMNAELSHIVFSPPELQNSKILLHKKPIFKKEALDRILEKLQSPQNNQQTYNQSGKSQQKKVNQEIPNQLDSAVSSQFQVEQHIQCTLFGNEFDKDTSEPLKNTGFDLNQSKTSKAKQQSPRKSIFNRIAQKSSMQKSKSLHDSYLTLKIKIKKLGGKKQTDSKKQEKQKLSLIRLINIEPSFF